MRRTMANLIRVYYFSLEDGLPNRNLIPGEVFITGDFKNKLVLNYSDMQSIHIVDMEKRLVRVTKWCHKCNAFHIENNKYHKLLGRHWKKYRIAHFLSLRIPITEVCNYSKNTPSGSGIGERGSRNGDFQILDT